MTDAEKLWAGYCAASGVKSPLPESDWFGDDPVMANQLLALVLSGQKQATCELRRQFGQGDIPKIGDHWIITDGRKIPRCIIQTTKVDICAVKDVDAKFAWDEGEGDRSLAYWKREHDAYFQRSAMRDGFTYSDDMDAICERFKLVWPV